MPQKLIDCTVYKYVTCVEEEYMNYRKYSIDSPLVELVHDLEVHVLRPQHVLVHEVERRVRDELTQVAVILFAKVLPGRAELHLEDGVVAVADDDEVVVARHENALRSHRRQDFSAGATFLRARKYHATSAGNSKSIEKAEDIRGLSKASDVDEEVGKTRP